MAFKKGQSGNPKGQSKGKPITDMLYRLCVQEDWERLRKALGKQLDKAVEGDQQAINFVAERLEGKAEQKVSANITHELEHSGESISDSIGWITEMLRAGQAGKNEESGEDRSLLSDSIPPEQNRH